MNKEIKEHIGEEELRKDIEELRDVLNEICATDEDAEQLKERLSVSRQLDKLIVKYMNKKMNKVTY